MSRDDLVQELIVDRGAPGDLLEDTAEGLSEGIQHHRAAAGPDEETDPSLSLGPAPS